MVRYKAEISVLIGHDHTIGFLARREETNFNVLHDNCPPFHHSVDER